MRQALMEYDPYEHGMQVLDTDYKTYMLLYHCNEDYPEAFEEETAYDIHSRLTHH